MLSGRIAHLFEQADIPNECDERDDERDEREDQPETRDSRNACVGSTCGNPPHDHHDNAERITRDRRNPKPQHGHRGVRQIAAFDEPCQRFGEEQEHHGGSERGQHVPARECDLGGRWQGDASEIGEAIRDTQPEGHQFQGHRNENHRLGGAGAFRHRETEEPPDESGNRAAENAHQHGGHHQKQKSDPASASARTDDAGTDAGSQHATEDAEDDDDHPDVHEAKAARHFHQLIEHERVPWSEDAI